MRETDALLRSTQILLMNFQTNTPGAVAISPLLVCYAQLKLPSTSSDLVRNIVCLTSNKPAWQGIRALHKEFPKENKKLMDCKETMQMLAARLSKEYKQCFTHQQRDNFIAMFWHPFMAHYGLHLMMHKACIIDEHLCDNMKEDSLMTY